MDVKWLLLPFAVLAAAALAWYFLRSRERVTSRTEHDIVGIAGLADIADIDTPPIGIPAAQAGLVTAGAGPAPEPPYPPASASSA